MPRLASPDMPPWAERVYEALGSRPGVAVLAALAGQDDPMPQRDVATVSGLSPQTASVVLQQLEDTGLVIGSVPPPRPRSTRVTWTLNRDALARLVADLTTGLGLDA